MKKSTYSSVLIIFISYMIYSCVDSNVGDNKKDNMKGKDQHSISNNSGENKINEDEIVSVNQSVELPKFSTHLFSGSGNCAECHSNLKDSSGEDVSIDSDWRSTMMANSAKDPLFLAKVSSEIIRNPDHRATIEKKCATCHMPMAKVEAEYNGDTVKIFRNGFLDKNNKYHTQARDGVSCSLCHQIQDIDLGTKESFSGKFKIDTVTKKPDREIFGPFQDVFTGPMRNRVGFTPTYSQHIKSSKLCATCHTLYTPTVDSNGNIVGEIPEQTPYLEWEHSDFGDGKNNDDISCQQCHMALASGKVKLANMPPFLEGREPFYKHYFVGGNLFMLNILKENISELGITAEEKHFDATISRTKDMLENKTATVEIENVTLKNDVLYVPVKVINLAGHKLPTGYPSRRVWIHLTVKDAEGNTVFESGNVDRYGKIVGNYADEKNLYEPHYNVIDSPDKVQIYESIMIDTEGKITYTLLKGKEYIKDNRILPKGFNKDTAPKDIDVKGKAKTDPDFTGGQDKILYKINVSNSTPPFTIEVELKYQSVSYRYFQDLIEDKENSRYISKFEEYYLKQENTGYTISKKVVKW